MSLLTATTCLLPYFLVLSLRWTEDGVVALAQITKQQTSSMDCSDTWRGKLDLQKRRRRDRALRRFGSK